MSFLPVSNNIINPAFVVDNCYYSQTNLKVSQNRVLARDSYRQSFLSLALPSNQISFTAPSNNLLGNLLITVSFDFTDPTTFQAGYFLPKGWLFSALRNVYWSYGGSEQISITGHQNFIRHMCECEEDYKKSALLGYGGQLVYKTGAGVIMGAQNGIVSATIPIYLPHSSVNAMKQIPFDANLLNQNVVIRIDLESADVIWRSMQTGGIAAPPALSQRMRTLNFGEFWLRQFEMIDSVASKKALVGPGSRHLQQYFFYFPQDFKSSTLKLDAAATGVSAEQAVILNGFKNGSLQSIILALERDPLNYVIEGNTVTNRSLPSYMNTKRLTNITLEYSGNIIYRAQYADAAQLLDLCNNSTDSTYAQESYEIADPYATTQAPLPAAISTRAALYRIQLSQFSEVFRDYLQTGADISANVMTLRFQVIDPDLTKATIPALTPRFYNLYAQYVYQASLAVQQGHPNPDGPVGHYSPLPDLPDAIKWHPVGVFQWTNPLPTPGPLMNGSVNDQIPRAQLCNFPNRNFL